MTLTKTTFDWLDRDRPQPHRGGRLNILIVEDSAVDALILEGMLQDQEYATARAASLGGALAHLEEWVADAVLLDLGLPDTEGVQGIARMRNAFPHLPILVVTGGEEEALVRWALRAGAQDYLKKDQLNAEQVVRAIQFAIARVQTERLRQRLENADRLALSGQLSAGIAHEINNPLAFMVANMAVESEHVQALTDLVSALQQRAAEDPALSALLQRFEPGRRLEELRDIVSDDAAGAERIRAIVGDLRRFATHDRSPFAPVDLNAAVRSAIDIANAEVRQWARIETDLKDTPPLHGDEASLSRLVVNLLLNAGQAIAAAEGSERVIRVATCASEQEVQLTVTDTGCGISEHHLSRLFEPFYTTKPRDKGTGLGLTLCADTVHSHHGTIRVTSEEGSGTTVFVRLPLAASTGAIEGSAAPRRRSLRALVVDEADARRTSGARALEREGLEVVAAATGAEALQILERDRRFDALVFELANEDMEAEEFFRHSSTLCPELRSRFVFTRRQACRDTALAFATSVGARVVSDPVTATALQQALRLDAKAS